MSDRAICQRCASSEFEWTIKQAEFHVGALRQWKVQLCRRCMNEVGVAVQNVLGRNQDLQWQIQILKPLVTDTQ